MGSGPVFQSSSDLAMWRRLSGSGSAKFALGKKGDAAEAVANEVLASKGSVNSAVLVRLMDTLFDGGSGRLASILPDMVAKRRSTDCAPALEAAVLYQRMGDSEMAAEMFETVRDGLDIPLRSSVHARLLLDRGDKPSAKKVLLHGRCSDPLDQRIYKLLEEADPAGGWMFYRNIELLYAGRSTVACGAEEEDTPQRRLYHIYSDWFGGARDAATDALVGSKEYSAKYSDYMLAAARMAADEKDWFSAEVLYDGLVKQGCTHITCEAARVCLNGGKIDKALSLYRDAEASDPHSPMVMEGLTDVYTKMGRRDDAAQCMLDFLDTERADLDAYLICAERLVSGSMNAHAEPVVRKILMNYPENTKANILKSKNDAVKGDYPGALDAATAAVKSDPKDPDARLQRAKVLFSMSRSEKAMKEAQAALKLSPSDTSIMVLIKDIYAAQGNNRASLEMCERILKLDPENADIMLDSSEVMMAMGDTEGSLSSYRKAIRADRRPENFITVVESLIRDGMYKEAALLCEEMDAEYGSIALVRRLRGNAEYSLGEYLKASVSFAAAAAADPFSPVIWHSKGMADEAAGDLDSAEEAYNRAVLMDLDEPEFWMSKASVQEKKGDLHGAIESLNRAIELNPESAYALVKKGMIFARAGKYKEALYFIDMAIMVDVWDKDIYVVKKEICMHAGMYEEAIGVCSDISIIDPKDTYAITDAADCMMKLGNRSGALSFINSKLAKDQSSIPLLLSRKIILTSMGNYPELIATCYRILEKDPKNRAVKNDLAHAFLSNGDKVSAEKIFAELEEEAEAVAKVAKEPVASAAEEKPEAEEVDDSDDDKALFDIANSLYSTGDLRGAARMADRALELEPGNTEYVLFRSEVYSADGDVRGAEAVVAEGLRISQEDPVLWEKDGDLRSSLGDIPGALAAYQNVMKYADGGNCTVYIKHGDLRSKIGDVEGAISDYSIAVSKCGSDNTARNRLASAHYMNGDIKDADKVVDTVLSEEPDNSEALVTKARIFSERRNQPGVLEMYKRLLRTSNPDPKLLEEMSDILSRSGRSQEATVLSQRAATKSDTEGDEEMAPDSVKRYAERLLRRAYVSKRSLDDPGIENMLELDQATSEAVMSYLSDITDYGEIIPGTPEFFRMEELSHSAVIRAALTDIDTDPIITIPCAFVAGGAKDADEAKILVSYIYSAINGKMSIEMLSDDVKNLASKTATDMSVFDIMKEHELGVYSARAVKLLSNSSSGTS
ncbi:MAG: tetratricopeptide repeat protein [Methanomassiliicoccaceae archaeon]|nr:tetratricopeptide repeat protein [Methanomassiliicoccaceae archaeon]